MSALLPCPLAERWAAHREPKKKAQSSPLWREEWSRSGMEQGSCYKQGPAFSGASCRTSCDASRTCVEAGRTARQDSCQAAPAFQ